MGNFVNLKKVPYNIAFYLLSERRLFMALDNKLGIIDSAELARQEEKISKKKAAMMFESDFFDELKPGSFEALVSIHKYLFEDIYDFAGKIRDVNLAKGNFRFAPLMYLNEALRNIEKMPQNSFDEIIEKYVEMNIAHPFREGNGPRCLQGFYHTPVIQNIYSQFSSFLFLFIFQLNSRNCA